MLPDFYVPRSPPMKHQADCLEESWQRDFYAILLEMGMGKSRTAIDNFCLLYQAGKCDCLIVIAPKSVYTNWTRIDDENPGEFQKWMWEHIYQPQNILTYRAKDMRNSSKVKTNNAINRFLSVGAAGPRILVVNKEAISATANARDFIAKVQKIFPRNMIVIDESTCIKNPKSNLTKSCLIIARSAAYRRILTGSISTGSPSDLFSQFEFLAPGRRILGHRTFTSFQAYYCILREIQVQGRTIKTEVGARNIKELAEIVSENAFRRTKKECLDLPEKIYMRRDVEITEEQQLAYNEIRRHAMTVIEGQEVTAEIALTQVMRCHQVLCGHIKTDEGQLIYIKNNRAQAMLDVIAETDEQVVIWAGFRPDVSVIVEALRKKYGEDSVAEWHGGIKMDERERGEAEFQAGRKRFMVSTDAGARGRTWTAATLVIYYSNDADLEIREQSEDRTHRIGTVGTVTYVDLVIPCITEEKVYESLRSKKHISRSIMSEGVGAWI